LLNDSGIECCECLEMQKNMKTAPTKVSPKMPARVLSVEELVEDEAEDVDTAEIVSVDNEELVSKDEEENMDALLGMYAPTALRKIIFLHSYVTSSYDVVCIIQDPSQTSLPIDYQLF